MPYHDRKSTRLNSSHGSISYAVFCLKKKKIKTTTSPPEIVHQSQLRLSTSLTSRHVIVSLLVRPSHRVQLFSLTPSHSLLSFCLNAWAPTDLYALARQNCFSL